jgi:hypothetical protein
MAATPLAAYDMPWFDDWGTTAGTCTLNASSSNTNAVWYAAADFGAQNDVALSPAPLGPLLDLPKEVKQINLPDGSVVHLDDHGNFRIEDKGAQVVYRAHRNRDFNPFVNAGELIGSFIDDVVRIVPGVRKADIPDLPLQLFVNWLILEAAQRDDDPVPPDVEIRVPETRLLVGRVLPRCQLPTCRRFVRRVAARRGFHYCNPEHASRHYHLLAA